MFTGLVEEIGVISNLQHQSGTIRFSVAANKVVDGLKVDDSIAVSGVCLTVVAIDKESFCVEAVTETLRKTTLGLLKRDSKVNLERALRLSDRLGGHIVQGHVDSIAEVSAITTQPKGQLLQLRVPDSQMKYIIPEGSICVDGVSLTVARLQANEITIALIPHTLANTTLGTLRINDKVNIEVDVVGKYVESLLSKSNSDISERWLRETGFITTTE